MSVRVIPKMDDLLERGERLKINKDKLAYYSQKFEATHIRPTVNQGGCCFCGRIRVDAIDYFKMNVEKDTEFIRREKGSRAECNSGMAVVTFVSRLQVSRCLDNSDFRQLALERLSPDELQQFYILSWDIKKAPTQSEILWTNLQKGGFKSQIKSWFLLLILMIVCIILVTPVILLRKLVPLLEALEKSVDGVTFLQKLMQILNEHLASLINLLFNVAIIPTAVSVVTELDDNKTMAKYQVSVMNRLFFFLVIIAIFLPLVG